MWLNYPNNPTGAVADLEFFERAVHWAKKHEMIIAHDNPYSEVAFDGYRPPSIFEVPGAKDIAVEFNSLSKTFSMAGPPHRHGSGQCRDNRGARADQEQHRLGHLRRNPGHRHSGLTGDQSWIPARNEIYRRSVGTKSAMC